MKILYYYWTQPDDKFRRGGGIQVYLNNIIPYLIRAGNEVFMLNSGVEYDFLKKRCYIKNIGEARGIHQFSIYNSPITAPARANFYHLDKYLYDESTKAVLADFIETYGPFDVIHFQSLEGIGLKVLELKNIYPQTKFIYTMHNYFPFCPQVNLWKDDSENCVNFNDGKDCMHCMVGVPSEDKIQKFYAGITLAKDIGLDRIIQTVNNSARKYLKIKKQQTNFSERKRLTSRVLYGEIFREFRSQNIKCFNLYLDRVLCVSKRVQNICERFGIHKEILQTEYIGTDFAERQSQGPKYDINTNTLQIAYIGYMRRDKGFYFFLEALKHFPDSLAKKIKIVVAARNENPTAVETLLMMREKFSEVKFFDGYTKENIADILKGTNIGVVPVLWEDNLPQVAMEFKAMGIPVLASDLGGASELTACKSFQFKSGDIDAFIEKIMDINVHRALLNEYYEKGRPIKTPRTHSAELLEIYRN